MASVLYISYDGLIEPLGQSQIVAYIEKLSGENEIHVISYEKPIDLVFADQSLAIRNRLNNAGIKWIPMRYHKKPTVLASLYDIFRGIFLAIYIIKKNNIKIVHARSYIPALIGLFVKKFLNIKLLFDIRGFWADERVELGIWKQKSNIYRIVKRVEKILFKSADHVVTLTKASVPVIKELFYFNKETIPITVIPTCADLNKFYIKNKITLDDHYIFGYVGSFGSSLAIVKLLDFFSAILEILPNSKLLIVNRDEHKLIYESVEISKIPSENVEIIRSSHSKIQYHIQRMHAAYALRFSNSSNISNLARAPTKIAEYLCCGIPCVGNDVGDTKEILKDNNVGVILDNFDKNSIKEGVKGIIKLSKSLNIQTRCRETAATNFSLLHGVNSYKNIYKKLISNS